MSETLVVLMGDTVAGTLERSRGGTLRFRYESSYIHRQWPTPLSVTMPTAIDTHPDSVVTAWLWGLLPDNDAVLRRWATTFHVSATTPFALLSSPVGEDCAGAVRFVRPERLEAAQGRQSSVHWLDEAGVAQRLRELREDATAWLGTDIAGRFSLAGAQVKTALFERDGRWGVPKGNIPTTHILKPAIVGLDDHELNEHLCLRAARFLGMHAASSALWTFEDQTAVVLRRYDRVRRSGGEVARVHQEDLCQALGVHPARKYEAEGGPSSAHVVRLFRAVLPTETAESAVRQFAEALIYNWLIGGTDAHAKNYAILLAGRQVRPAPLYDVASVLPYPSMHIRKLRLAMKIACSYTLLARDTTMWSALSHELGLPGEELADRARVLMDQLPDAFATAAQEESVQHMASPLPARLVDAVAHRVTACRATVT